MAEVDKLFAKGKEAFEKKNYDYGIDLFKQILSIDPDHVQARQALRATCLKKCQDHGFPSAGSAAIKGLGSRFGAMLGGITKNYNKKIDSLQDLLCNDPNNAKVRVQLGEALKESGHLTGAIVELEAAISLDTNNAVCARILGDCYREKGDIKKAVEYYNIVTRVMPEDRHAAGALKDLLAMGSMKEGWDDAKSSRDMIKDKDKAKELAESHKVYKTDEELDSELTALQEKIDADPENPQMAKQWVKIGDIHMRKAAFEEASSAYERARELDPNDARIKMKIGDVKVKEFEIQLSELGKTLKEDPENEELKKEYQALRMEKLKFQIGEWRQRVKDHPTELGLRYDLGTFLRDAGEVDAAIQEFQQTVKDPKRKLESLDALGQCFYKKKMYELAAGQFSKAIEATTSSDREKALRYWLGKSYQQGKDIPKALEQYKKILEIDYSYKDVAKLVETLDGGE